MSDKGTTPKDSISQRQMALSKWDTDGGRKLQRGLPSSADVPPLTDAELIHLRVRVIALENMVMSLLAQVPSHQLDHAREVASYILPRPGYTQHPLTIHAAHQMIDLVERAEHLRVIPPT